MSKKQEIKGLIEDLRTVADATLSRKGCLILADLIEEQQNEIIDLKMQLSNCKLDLSNARVR